MNANAAGLPVEQLETPTLCLDLDVYERNVRRMKEYIMERHGLAWRPHMKGQKAPELARLAVEAGAIGVTCATVYEAQVMAGHGIASILLANQVAGERKLDRLAQLQQRAEVIAATDSAAHAAMLGAAAVRNGVTIPVMVELNVGMNRSGIAPGAPTLELVRAIDATPGLRLAGLMGWEGHVLAYTGEEKIAHVRQAMTALVETAEACRAAGFAVPIVSAGGSGTFLQCAPCPGLTEMQAGGGVFGDLSYAKWGLEHEYALTVLTRVVSRPTPTRVIVDGGFKTMSSQHGLPSPIGLAVVKLTLSAEHGNLELEQASDAPRVGDVVVFIPGYTDSTVCLHDEMCATRAGRVESVWRIPGRSGALPQGG
jgi:D-serine deaminase-like pyridoxal phosphate-dependent protein